MISSISKRYGDDFTSDRRAQWDRRGDVERVGYRKRRREEDKEIERGEGVKEKREKEKETDGELFFSLPFPCIFSTFGF